MPETATSPKLRKSRGMVYIELNRCKGCGFCVEFCPPRVLAISEEFNAHGYHPPYLVDEAGCTGCDLCGLYCPDFAIFGVRKPAPPAVQEVSPGNS
jgi:2-oxoglutarate ferredoxin oxidoreductase subunit delta